MKFNELIKDFTIARSNEETKVLKLMTDIMPYDSFSERVYTPQYDEDKNDDAD